MSHRMTPWQEIRNGAVWPLVPLGLVLGIFCAGLYPGIAMKYWFDFFLMAAILFAFKPLMHWHFFGVMLFFAMFCLGYGRLGYNFTKNETQILSYRYFGPIEGRVVDIDQSHSGKLRLTLDNVYLSGRPLKGLARISLHGEYDEARAKAGVRVQTTGHLSPPNGPAEPGGYNFRKRAWIEGIAGVGYSRNPAMFAGVSKAGMGEWILNQRRQQSKLLRERLGERYGGFVSAIYIGDRSQLEDDLVENMRNTNLAHLLAISGMHMGTVCGLMFFVFRRSFGYLPWTRHNGKALQLGILGAVLGTSLYFIFSGMAYSAMRAYMMSMLFFAAMALGRRAFSLRSIGAVVVLILIFDPNALNDIGFQLSFCATIALVVAFDMVPLYYLNIASPIRWVIILLFTSFVAGLATMPLSAFHFNQIPKYGLLANVMAVPIMSFWILPLMILWSALRLLGVGDFALKLAGLGVEKIDEISIWVAGFETPVWRVGSASEWGLVLILLAGLIFAFSRWRGLFLASVLIGMGVFLWPQKDRPYLFVADTARFFAVEQNGKRWFSRGTGHSFLAEIWAKGDGQIFAQEKYALPIENDWAEIDLKEGWRLIFTTTKKGAKRVQYACRERTLIIAAQAERPEKGLCVFYNDQDMLRMGGVAIDIENGELIATPFIDDNFAPWNAVHQR